MKAYSLHDREVGYCQGSGFIVGLLLLQVNAFDKSRNRREALERQEIIHEFISSLSISALLEISTDILFYAKMY